MKKIITMDRKARLKLPSSTRDILTLFSLSRTNQILRGRSPIFEEKDEDTRGWAELVASEIYSAKVDVVPMPAGMMDVKQNKLGIP